MFIMLSGISFLGLGMLPDAETLLSLPVSLGIGIAGGVPVGEALLLRWINPGAEGVPRPMEAEEVWFALGVGGVVGLVDGAA